MPRTFVQIYLPVHQAAGSEEVLNGVDTFGFYHEMVFFHIEHLVMRAEPMLPSVTRYRNCRGEGSPCAPCRVVRDQLVQELLGVFVLEYLDGKCELSRSFLC